MAGWLVLSALLAWTTVQPKCRPVNLPASLEQLGAEDVSFASGDGTRLSGWLVGASEKQRLGVVILCHGIDGDRESMALPASVLVEAGFAALLFDFRARGESEGGLCTVGYRETEDLLAAVAAVRSNPKTAELRIGVMGESMGGAVALLATARTDDIGAVVAESPFASMDEAIENHFRSAGGAMAFLFAGSVKWFGERMIGTSAREISPARCADRIAPRPALLIACQEDRLCPAEGVERIAASIGPSAALWRVPGAGHIEARIAQPGEYARQIREFFRRNLERP